MKMEKMPSTKFARHHLTYEINVSCYATLQAYTVNKGVKFPSEFWSALLGRPKSDLLIAHFFVIFKLLLDCWQVGDLLFDLCYLWASGCSFWLLSLRHKSRYALKKCPKLTNLFYSVRYSSFVIFWHQNNCFWLKWFCSSM